MKCPCCKSELLEVRELDQTEQVARGEFEHPKLHVCQRCGGGWMNRRQLTEVLLERLQQVGLGELIMAHGGGGPLVSARRPRRFLEVCSEPIPSAARGGTPGR